MKFQEKTLKFFLPVIVVQSIQVTQTVTAHGVALMDEIPKKSLIIVRDASVGDQAFIFSSFLKGLYYGNEFFKQIDKTVFMKEYSKILTSLLIKSQCKVACLKDDVDTIVGYSIYEPGTAHYIFIKPAWRRIGLAKDLLPVDINSCTHITKIGKALKPPSWKFNPWLI